MAALVPDEKCGVCLDSNYFFLTTNAASYNPGPVAPFTADGAPIYGVLPNAVQHLVSTRRTPRSVKTTEVSQVEFSPQCSKKLHGVKKF